MERLKSRMTEPAGGWRYREADLKVWVRASTFNKLVMAVAGMRRANNLVPVENLSEIIEDYICRHTAPVFVDNPSPSYLGLVTNADMINAMQSFTGVRARNKDLAVMRSLICIKCTHNCPTVCLSCHGHDTRMQAEYGLDPMKHDALLHVCQVDATALMAVVQMAAGDVSRCSAPRSQYPETCWKRETP